MRTAQLSQVAKLDYGFAFDSKQFNTDRRGLPLVRIRDVVRGRSDTYYSGEYADRYLVKDGDYLIGMDGQFNLARWRGGQALLNQRVCRIGDLDASLDRAYLARFMPLALKAIEDATPFVTVKHLSAKALNAIEVPLPCLLEQRRIAAILDHADALRAQRRHLLAEIDALTQAVFAKRFGSWEPSVELQTVCRRITDGTHQSPTWADAGIPFLFVSNITSGEIDLQTQKFISQDTWADLTRRTPIEIGDVLYSTVGSYGIPALVRTDERFAFQRHIAHIKPDTTRLDPAFLAAQMASPRIRRQATRAARGVAQPTVNLADIKKFSVVVPPIEEQRSFATVADAIRSRRVEIEMATSRGDELFASLQSRAFRGEL